MKKDSLSRLHEIRKRREEKARDVVIAKESERRRASIEVDRAVHNVQDHARSARDQEHEMIGSMIGKVFRAGALHNFQTNLDNLSHEQKNLAKIEMEAREALAEKSNEVKEARQQYTQQQRKTAKLSHVLKVHGKRLLRRQLGVMEAADDDQNGAARRQMDR